MSRFKMDGIKSFDITLAVGDVLDLDGYKVTQLENGGLRIKKTKNTAQVAVGNGIVQAGPGSNASVSFG